MRFLCVSLCAVLALAIGLTRSNVRASSRDVVLYAADAARVAGAWRREADASAAGGARLRHPNAGAAKLTAPLAAPSNYFEIAFPADAGVGYRIWMRGRADSNSYANDSAFLQFSDSVNASGSAIYRIGSTSASTWILEDALGAGLSGWGWADNGYGAQGPLIYFASSGPHTLRVQTREDGLALDQIVLSADTWLSAAPGATKNDSTILSRTGEAVTLVRHPYLQRVSSTRATVVWATREPGAGAVRIWPAGGAARTVAADTRRVPATQTAMTFDYYQHETDIEGLASATTYNYEILHDGADATPGITDTLTTAPAVGSAATVRFIAFGDSGIGSAAQRQLAGLMSAETFDLALHAGDLVYGTTATTGDATYTTYHSWFFDIYRDWLRRKAFFPTLGNHDARASNGHGRAYLDLFVLPENGASPAYPDHAERFYSFDWGPAHVVVLDTELALQEAARRQAQLDWLENDLRATAQPWKIALFHRSPYSAGGEHGSDLAVRAAFAPVFEAYGVQLSISAHEHNYERSIPWKESATGHEVTYVVTGGGGAALYPAGRGAWTAYSASVYHYVRGSVTTCTLRLDAIDLDTRAFDGVTIDRCGGGTADDVVLYASDVAAGGTVEGDWSFAPDATAADGTLLRNPNRGAAKIAAAAVSPASYFEATFDAEGSVPYRLWVRGRAAGDSWANDSIYVQFSDSVDGGGAATLRIGSTSGSTVNLEECSGCGLAGWGWQDNGYGAGVLGPLVRFAATGTHRIRVQVREDGLSIDQIVLSPSRFLNAAPGATKNDTTIVPR